MSIASKSFFPDAVLNDSYFKEVKHKSRDPYAVLTLMHVFFSNQQTYSLIQRQLRCPHRKIDNYFNNVI